LTAPIRACPAVLLAALKVPQVALEVPQVALEVHQAALEVHQAALAILKSLPRSAKRKTMTPGTRSRANANVSRLGLRPMEIDTTTGRSASATPPARVWGMTTQTRETPVLANATEREPTTSRRRPANAPRSRISPALTRAMTTWKERLATASAIPESTTTEQNACKGSIAGYATPRWDPRTSVRHRNKPATP
jgi:hypothetical protein